MSPSDPEPHITLAVATSDMQKQKLHNVMHCRASSEDIHEATFVGTKAYTTQHKDDRELRDSYKKPYHIRTSLMPEEDEGKPFPVGFVLGLDGSMNWYVLNKHGKTLYIESDFYMVGEGSSAHMQFLHPELNKPVKAKFYGLERPTPVSPNPEPTNLEAGMSSLSLTDEQFTQDFELVHLSVKLGNKMSTPLRCDTKRKASLKTGWADWEYLNDIRSFQCEWYNEILRCPTLPDGVENVEVEFDSRLPKPFYFHTTSRGTLYTTADYWHHGKNSSFFVYLERGVFYLTYNWPKEDVAFQQSEV
ncbi:hypothetical protein MANI_022766 [Metarhizium anisopliae]|nr:hypothetical protein MANI_022766 [Metarhizium anisopliae]